MLVVFLVAFVIALIAYTFRKLSIEHANYFEKRNLKYTGVSYALGNMYGLLLGKFDAIEFSRRMHKTFPNETISAVFDFGLRQYVIRDPAIYKHMVVKDFDYFQDHRSFEKEYEKEKLDKLWGNGLFLLTGEKWRQMRATLSPAFTGSKMRQMFELVSECANEVVDHFTKKAENGEKINIEMKDFFSRYTNDVIATCAFGVKVNSFADPKNEFYLNGKALFNFAGFKRMLTILVIMLMPKVARALKLKFIDAKVGQTFKSLILDTMEIRKKNNIHRPDMINIMMQVRDGTLKHEEKSKETSEGFATVDESEIGKATVTRKWNDDEVVAQCLIFFIAGFETTSTALTFTAYELVVNPDIQQKLYEEIVEMNEQLNGTRITYDSLQKMKYMDQVICETLRKWPFAQFDRICGSDYVYDDGNKRFVIEKGSSILFSTIAIHRDPTYFPDPDKFDPERFSDENKSKIVSGSYTPFGVGPRNCIGSCFALMELKAILYYLLLNFSFEANKDTQIPIKLKKSMFLGTENGVHLELKPRNKLNGIK